jgi:hypothetical protein
LVRAPAVVVAAKAVAPVPAAVAARRASNFWRASGRRTGFHVAWKHF